MSEPLDYYPMLMSSKCGSSARFVKPRIILHGGAGNITRDNLSPEAWDRYHTALLRILRSTISILDPESSSAGQSQRRADDHCVERADDGILPTLLHGEESNANETIRKGGTDALTAAVHAVKQLEDDPLFNAAVGAVFNREGRVELEASVMVSSGHRKRGVGVSGIRHVRSPVGLAAEMLRRGAGDEEGLIGAQGHVQLNGPSVEGLAKEWGLEMCQEKVFYTRKRWEEHKRGLKRSKRARERDARSGTFDSCVATKPDNNEEQDWAWGNGNPGWDGHEYLPQGTVGCVVLDRYGTLAVATSTGGLTNKLPGRLGDTPTIGAGFWAEEWFELQQRGKEFYSRSMHRAQIPLPRQMSTQQWPAAVIVRNLTSLDPFGIVRKCLGQSDYKAASPKPTTECHSDAEKAQRQAESRQEDTRHAVALGGTGNGDSFLRLCAARTVAARVRFGSDISLSDAVNWMAGPGGELQQSAEDRWGVTGEGEGGIIGIELENGEGRIAAGFNRAMFRAWIDDDGKERCMVFHDEY